MGNENSSSTSRKGVNNIDSDAVIDLTNNVIKNDWKIQVMKDGKVTFIQASKAALIGGACILTGTVVAGPLGTIAGGLAGGLVAKYYTEGTYKSLIQIVNEFPSERKRQIAREIMSIPIKIGFKNWEEFVEIASLWICGSLASAPQKALVQEFIQLVIPIIKRYVQECNGNDGN
jgi:hypothetical protein